MRLAPVPPEAFGWMTNRSGYSAGPEARGIAALTPEGEIAGMLVFDGWTPNGCFVHAAVDRPVAWRKLVSAGCDYVFNQAERSVVMGRVRAGHQMVRKLAASMGFQEVGRIPDGWELGEDLILLQLRRDGCRWLQKERWAA